jgi:hypothetical protein
MTDAEAERNGVVPEGYDPPGKGGSDPAADSRGTDTSPPRPTMGTGGFSAEYWIAEAIRDQSMHDPALGIRLDVSQGYSLTEALATLQRAMMALPEGPHIFQRAHMLCRIVYGAHAPRWLTRSADAPVILEAEAAWLRMMAQQAVACVRLNKRTHDWDPVHPPRDLIETLQVQRDWVFPPLLGVLTAPTLRPDGSLLCTPGYDVSTQLYLDHEMPLGTLADAPTQAEAQAARQVLEEPFVDFPFAAPHDKAAALAAVLSILCRYTLAGGSVPLFGITATTRASGKGLLCDVIATIATGRAAAKWAPTLDPEEERKSLLALALEGDALVCIDNCVAPLGSPALDSALTAATIRGRILGQTALTEVPMQAVFFATGNNLRYKGDLARRAIPVALDPKMEHPEERTAWQHPDLLAWVRAHRDALVMAALTIMRGYFAAGCPPQGVTALGSFEDWSRLIREALLWAGTVDPCLGRHDLEAESDSDYDAIDTVLHAWHSCYDTMATTLHAAGHDILMGRAIKPEPPTKWDDLYEALAVFDRRADGVKPLSMDALGKALHGFQGRVIDGRRLIKAGKTRTNKILWQLEILSTSNSTTVSSA